MDVITNVRRAFSGRRSTGRGDLRERRSHTRWPRTADIRPGATGDTAASIHPWDHHLGREDPAWSLTPSSQPRAKRALSDFPEFGKLGRSEKAIDGELRSAGPMLQRSHGKASPSVVVQAVIPITAELVPASTLQRWTSSARIVNSFSRSASGATPSPGTSGIRSPPSSSTKGSVRSA